MGHVKTEYLGPTVNTPLNTIPITLDMKAAGTSDADGTSSEQPETSNMTHEEILQILCRLLKQCVPSCQHVRVIPSSRRPVIKFIHKESGLHCDLSLDNSEIRVL